MPDSDWWEQVRKDRDKPVDLGLRPSGPMRDEHEFLPVAEPVKIGHSFEHQGRRWRVTWCQKQKNKRGYLIMIVPDL